MDPKGGTEILKEQLIAQLEPGSIDGINLIGSICHPSLIKKDQVNVVWQHLSYDQPNVQFMRDRKFVDSVDFFVYNSHWCFNRFRDHFKIPEYKSFVIKNNTFSYKEPIVKKMDGRLKIIYTPTPWRGLEILVRCVEKLNKIRDDFTVDVYSSTKIYGSEFKTSEDDKFEKLYELCRNTKNMNYIGYAPNEEVREALKSSHIFAYPSIFEETSCIAAIEAMMAGCHTVTTNFGALPETCGDFATMIEFNQNGLQLIDSYTSALNTVMDNYKNNVYKEDLELQVKFYKKYYSWETRIEEWKNFFNYVRQEKTN